MGILDFLWRKRKEKRAYSMVTADARLTSLLNVKTNEQTAMEIPAVSACVDFIAGMVAALPVRLYRDHLDGTTKELTDDERVRLLNDHTGDLLDPYQMKYAVVRDYLMTGNGFIYPVMERNRILSLRYVDSRRVSVVKGWDPIYKNADYYVGERRFMEDQLFRVCRHSTDGVSGHGVVEEHEVLFGTVYKEMMFERYLVESGGNKKGFLQTDEKVSDEVLKSIREAWRKLYSNNENNMMVLNNGLKFVECSNTSVEMQLNENKVKNNELICEVFGLSPAVIAGTATDEQYISAIKTAVLPVVEAYQAALNHAFLLPSQRKECYFVMDTKQLLKGDILRRYQAYHLALSDKWIQKNEVRYEEDLSPMDYDFIELGLADVLLDVKNKTIYTPNTNQMIKFGESGIEKALTDGESGIIEERSNDGSRFKKDEHGHFAGSTPYASGGDSEDSGGGSSGGGGTGGGSSGGGSEGSGEY